MIVDVPVPSDYHTAGVNQLYLGWQIAMQTLNEYDHAKEHAAFALRQPHLARWNTVTILLNKPRAFPNLTNTDRVLGYWRRGSDNLDWVADARADQPDLGLTLI